MKIWNMLPFVSGCGCYLAGIMRHVWASRIGRFSARSDMVREALLEFSLFAVGIFFFYVCFNSRAIPGRSRLARKVMGLFTLVILSLSAFYMVLRALPP